MPVSYRCNLHAHGKTKEGKNIDTKKHFDYICREGKYKNIRNHGEDLQYKRHGNLPEWAENQAGKFWNEAEKNRTREGIDYTKGRDPRAYREFELTLQMELSLDDNIACVDEFLKRMGIEQNHVFSYAIHDRPARLDNEMRNIHAHIMFDERTIEHDRPIDSPELYFKKYCVNKEGEPVGGYKKDRSIHDKPYLMKARKVWADIVNEKLAQRGIEERVSHESLKAQAQKLSNEGKEEEADLLNRTPAPKMAGLYRNPTLKEQIEEKMRKFEAGIPEKPIDEMNHVERNITLYARDAVLRKAARQIQQERLKHYKKVKADMTAEEAKSIMEAPIVVTVNDIREHFWEKEMQAMNDIKEMEASYSETRKQILKKEWYTTLAMQRMTDNEYLRLRKEIKRNREAYEEEFKKHDEIAADRSVDSTEKYLKYMEDLQKLKAGIEQDEQRYNELIKMCTETRKQEYEKILKEIEKENETKITDNKKLYGKISSKKKELEAIRKVLDDFKDIDDDMILYSKMLPRTLSRNDKVNGTTPIKNLKACSYKGNIYFIINGEGNEVDAIRFNDDIVKGKVPVYHISRKQDEEGKYKVTKVEATDKMQNLYREKHPKDNKTLKDARGEENKTISHAHAVNEQARRNAEESMVDKLLEEKTAKLRLRWNEKDNHRLSAMEEAERKLYEGWHPAFPPRQR